MSPSVVFQRPEHLIIATLLHGMDADFLSKSRCYFGGGTAIVLHHGEYRLPMDAAMKSDEVDAAIQHLQPARNHAWPLA
jgi:hypothetical protein